MRVYFFFKWENSTSGQWLGRHWAAPNIIAILHIVRVCVCIYTCYRIIYIWIDAQHVVRVIQFLKNTFSLFEYPIFWRRKEQHSSLTQQMFICLYAFFFDGRHKQGVETKTYRMGKTEREKKNEFKVTNGSFNVSTYLTSLSLLLNTTSTSCIYKIQRKTDEKNNKCTPFKLKHQSFIKYLLKENV